MTGGEKCLPLKWECGEGRFLFTVVVVTEFPRGMCSLGLVWGFRPKGEN